MDDEEFEDEVVRERQQETMNFVAQDPAALEETGEKEPNGNGPAVNTQPRASRSMDHRRNPSVNAPST